MIKYKKKILFFNIEESWFSGKLNLIDFFSFKVVYHLKTNQKMFGIRDITHTIEIDLEQDIDSIFSNFAKMIRQQFKKSESEGIELEFDNNLDSFVEFFNDFAAKKGTNATSKERLLEKKDFLTISFAKHKGEILAAHSYLYDKEQKIVRHYQASTKRFDDNVNKNFVGQANKYLLVSNIIRFKEQGYKTFDMGGYAANTTDESLLGINNYKLKFGGQVTECLDYYSVPYWALRKLGKVFGWVGTT